MFARDVEMAIMQHAMWAFPVESNGVVVNGQYVWLANSSPDADQAFDCADLVADLVRQGVVIQAVAHSHPYSRAVPQSEPHSRQHPKNDPWPTKDDMEGQAAMDVPWSMTLTDGVDVQSPIWWGPGVPVPPLEGRDYRWGPSGSDGKGDCLALIRDWQKVHMGLDLPDCPRDYGWWERGANLYEDNVTPFGFTEVHGEPQRGDVFLMAASSGVMNHGGVFIGGGMILHHATNKLSKIVPVRVFQRHTLRWFRHAGH